MKISKALENHVYKYLDEELSKLPNIIFTMRLVIVLEVEVLTSKE